MYLVVVTNKIVDSTHLWWYVYEWTSRSFFCFFVHSQRRKTMTRESQITGPSPVPLQHGFHPMPPRTKKWLNTAKLQKLLRSREREFRNSQGSPAYAKLMSFCNKCLAEGNEETIVTVVGDGGASYQCLFECNDASESFVLNSMFFRDFVSPSENKNTTPTAMSATA